MQDRQGAPLSLAVEGGEAFSFCSIALPTTYTFKCRGYFGSGTCLLNDVSCSTNLITSTWQVYGRKRSAALLMTNQEAFIDCFQQFLCSFFGIGKGEAFHYFTVKSSLIFL